MYKNLYFNIQLQFLQVNDNFLNLTCSKIPLRSPRGMVANVQNYDIIVSEFELQSNYCIHF